jgi:hypothetical protein
MQKDRSTIEKQMKTNAQIAHLQAQTRKPILQLAKELFLSPHKIDYSYE